MKDTILATSNNLTDEQLIALIKVKHRRGMHYAANLIMEELIRRYNSKK